MIGPGDIGSPLAVQGPPDGPIGDWLGYIVIFAVVVWPILRGLLESAQTQRKEFERKQRRQQPVDPASGQRRPTLDELLRGEPFAMEEEATLRRPEPEPAPTPPPAAANREARRRAAEDARDAGSLVGDPFDESSMGRGMGRDLVADEDLMHIPDEDELERSSGRRSASRAEVTAAGSAGRGTPDERFTGLGETSAAMQTSGGEASRGSSDKSLARLERQYSSWKRAFILHEVLGAPRAAKPFEDRTF